MVALVDPPAAVAVLLVGVGLAAYALVIWTMRGPLGLDAFRSALRRRRRAPAPQLPAGG